MFFQAAEIDKLIQEFVNSDNLEILFFFSWIEVAAKFKLSTFSESIPLLNLLVHFYNLD